MPANGTRYMTRREALELVESFVAKAAVGQGDMYSPAFVQIDPVTGKITFDFTGHIKAEGIDLLAGTTESPPDDRKIRWLSETDGALVAQIYGFEQGGNNEIRLTAQGNIDTLDDAKWDIRADLIPDPSFPSRYGISGLFGAAAANADGANIVASILANLDVVDSVTTKFPNFGTSRRQYQPIIINDEGFSDYLLPEFIGAHLRGHAWAYSEFCIAGAGAQGLPCIDGDYYGDANGTGATVSGVAQVDTGIWRCETGTTATGFANILTSAQSLSLIPNRDILCGWRARVPILSTATQRFSVAIGFGFNDPLNPLRFAAFRYSDNINSGKWQLVTANDTPTVNTADSGITVDTGFHWFEVIAKPRPTSLERADFFIDGTWVGGISGAGILSNFTGPVAVIRKSVGTTGRELEVDAAYYHAFPDRDPA